MDIDIRTIFIVVIISLFIILSVVVVEFVVANFFGIRVSELPQGARTFLHILGMGLIIYVIRKIFVH